MAASLADSNPFRRPSLTRSEQPPSYILPSNNPFYCYSADATTATVPQTTAGPRVPATATEPGIAELNPDPITFPTPAYTRVPTNSERTLVAPRRPDQRAVEAPPILDAQPPVGMMQQLERSDVPPPYELHVLSPKETSSGQTNCDSSQSSSFLNIRLGGLMFGNGDRRMHEYREDAEAQRRDLEKTNKRREQRRRRGGIWRCIICCLPTQRKQAKTTLKKKWLILVGLGLLAAIITTIVLVVKATKEEMAKGAPTKNTGRPSLAMLDLPGLPPMPTGLGIVQPASEPTKGASCYIYPSLWSCNLPPPSQSLTPEFLFEIRHRESDPYRQAADSLWEPVPASLPSLADLQFMGGRDNVTGSREGEETEFTISLVSDSDNSPVTTANSQGYTGLDLIKRTIELDLVRKQIDSIADPSQDPANMLPTVMKNQPVRLYDKGLDSEHYETYIYFNKHIYLKSLNSSKPATSNIEAIGSQADVACALRFTTFKVQIWTRKLQEYVIVDKEQNRMGIDPEFGRMMRNDTAIIPYPVTVTEDRDGGPDDDPDRATVCWFIVNDDQNPGVKKLGEAFGMSEKSYKALEPGDRGCFCEWTNWREKGRLDMAGMKI